VTQSHVCQRGSTGGPETLARGSRAAPRLCASAHALACARVLADTDPGDTIPLASVGKEALDKTVEYMEKMAAFKTEGTSDEDKLAWVGDYKKTMEAQDQLPLLFQTMTAANFMNVKTLLDELCKFVAEMIAQRTPNEILDYFNIKKDATWSAPPSSQRARCPRPEPGVPARACWLAGASATSAQRPPCAHCRWHSVLTAAVSFHAMSTGRRSRS
jgi:S-phase kinase-associated protein 1